MPTSPRLIYLSGSAAGLPPGAAFPLTAAETLLGRSETCDIPLASPTVSRHHARITRQGEDFILDDLGSTLGTYVNGASIGKNPYPLTPGDQIRLGRDVSFEFQI
jgi:pSer/pThr/pTyr-binding forkhead associated (FHA) protein